MKDVDVLFELGSLLPSIGIGLLFWFVLRSILRADKAQRAAERDAEAEWQANRAPAQREVAGMTVATQQRGAGEGSAGAFAEEQTAGEPNARNGDMPRQSRDSGSEGTAG